MPINDPIQQPIEVVGGDEAQRELRDTANEVENLGDAQADAGRQAERASDQQRDLGNASNEAEGGVSVLVGGLGRLATSMLGAVTAGFGLINLFNSIRDTAREASNAVANLGEQNRGLAANIGGLNADDLTRASNEAALRESLGVEGRNALIASATTLSDLRPDLTPQDLADRISQLARLRRATGVGGTEAVDLLQSLETRLGITGQDAIDQATGLLNAGIAPQTLGGIVERVGESSGPELLDLLFAVRDQVNLGTSGEAINAVFGAVSRTDSNGQVDPLLASLGVSQDDSPIRRIELLAAAFERGDINQNQLRQALGGNEGLRIGPALARELSDGLEDDRAERLAVTADAQIANIIQSGFVRAADRRNDRDLRDSVSLETSSLAALGEAEQNVLARLQERGGGNAILGAVAPLQFVGDEQQLARLEREIAEGKFNRRVRIDPRLGGFDPLADVFDGQLPPPLRPRRSSTKPSSTTARFSPAPTRSTTSTNKRVAAI
ncbi:MAG: hypothetical protein AAF823_16160 [Planctomycetota bacterium]